MRATETSVRTAPPAPSAALLFLILGALVAFLPVAMDLYLPAMPAIGEDFGASSGAVQLTLSAFLLGAAVGQFAYGSASDRFGRRPPLFAGLALYALASLGCALAPTIETLIAFRFLQAFGAASGMVIARAIVFDMRDVRTGARYMARLMLIMGLAPILAPILGGWLVEASGWRAIFYVVTGFAALVFALALWRLPETRSEATAQNARGENLLQATGALLRNGPLMRTALVGASGSASFFTYLSNAPHLIIEIYGVAPTEFGYYFGANAIVFVAAAQVNGFLLGRFHPARILNVAVIVAFALSLILAGVVLSDGGKWPVLTAIFFLIGALPFIAPNAAALAQGEDPIRSGAVSALQGAMSFAAGGALGALTGFFHDGTPRPMAIVIVLGAALACLLRWTGPRDEAAARATGKPLSPRSDAD